MQTDDAGPAREAIQLTWSGRETAAHVIAALPRQAKIEIALPQSMHHALFSRVCPDAGAAGVEAVDAMRGPELADTLATLAGLEALAELSGPLARAGYRLHLQSPGPVLSLIPPEMA